MTDRRCEFCTTAPATVYGGFAGAGGWAGYSCARCAALSEGFRVWDRLNAARGAIGVEPWHGRRVYDSETGSYLGRADGEPWSDGVEGVIALKQDEEGQTIRPHALCAFVVLDAPPNGSNDRSVSTGEVVGE